MDGFRRDQWEPRHVLITVACTGFKWTSFATAFAAVRSVVQEARATVLASVVAVSWTGRTLAGPPYSTDAPEPVEFRHWEFYLASQHAHARDGWSGTSPHFEVSYGVIPNMQLHLIAPLAYASYNDGRSAYGGGDTELGIKYLFI